MTSPSPAPEVPAELGRRSGPDRRRRVAAGAWVVGTLVVVAGGWWGYDRMTETDACTELSTDVVDAPAIAWDNGVTVTGPHWSAVLTDGVEHAATDVQPTLARAVVADQDGYDDLRAALPEETRAVADRLRARVLDPAPAATRRADPAAQADIASFRRTTTRGCHIV